MTGFRRSGLGMRAGTISRFPGGGVMGIGVSVVLIAIGAILAFAIQVDAEGFNLNTIGVILLVVGALGLLVALIVAGTASRRADRTVVRERDI